MNRIYLLAAALLLTACSSTPPAQSAASLGANPATAATDASSKPEEVCLLLKLTGTNIPKKYCRTTAEWERMAANVRHIAREFLSQTQTRSGILEAVDPSPF